MFTGIIEGFGEVKKLIREDENLHITMESSLTTELKIDQSVDHNGVCLTVITKGRIEEQNWFDVEISAESISITNISSGRKAWSIGQSVNLERALKMGDELGGHIVSGHVDGIGEVVSLHEDARSWRFRIRAPRELAKYVAHKGSITVDGTSLTVNHVDGAEFELNIVPHTMIHTIMGDYQVGSKVNLEVDLVARYLERLLLGDKAADSVN